MTYIYDTYALVEILKENPSYKKYAADKAIINSHIFAEFCYFLIKQYGLDKTQLRDKLKAHASAIELIDAPALQNAALFRYQRRKQKISMTDAVSYMQARSLGIKFLTGDKEFEHLSGVEFVK